MPRSAQIARREVGTHDNGSCNLSGSNEQKWKTMPYVMVPVPEKHVEDVMDYILRAITQGSIEPWDHPSISDFYHEVDEATRSVLAFVARAEAEEKELDTVAAARAIQMTPREVNGILNELQTTTGDAKRPPIVVARTVSERLPNGRVTDKRVLVMESGVAELVREVERAELAEAREALDPLREQGG
ncbi:MAG: hypothetical protein JJE46_12765 [Acidimicrobiia bacterium]|nr:hypothetical protein [Acidimicrobiia bacterium]